MAFDPYHLNPTASLNRLQIVDLPGLNVDPSVKGKTGYELVSAHYLCEQIRQYGEELKLSTKDLSQDERELPLTFDRCFHSADAQVHDVAERIARQFGRNLAYLLLTLKRGDKVNREARVDWDDSNWDYWRDIRKIRLGGGLISGHISDYLLSAIQSVDTANQLPPVVEAYYGSSLSLVGAARYTSNEAEQTIVLDFGGSFVKRACGLYDHDSLYNLMLLPSLPTQAMDEGQAQDLFDFIASVIAQTWNEFTENGAIISSTIPVSMAAYINNGQLEERQGGEYARLRQVSDNVEQSLSDAVSSKLETTVHVRLLHDGTAAASIYAGEAHSAVITLGTTIGIGFPPPAEKIRKMDKWVMILPYS